MANSQTGVGRWLWPIVIVVLAILLLIVLFSPSGDTEDPQVEDPIVTPEFQDPAEAPAQTDMQGQDTGAQTAPAPEPFAPGGDPE